MLFNLFHLAYGELAFFGTQTEAGTGIQCNRGVGGDTLAVDIGAIGGIEVNQNQLTAPVLQFAMMATNTGSVFG